MKTTVNSQTNIVLRQKSVKTGYHLYLDIHHNGERRKEYLKLYISNKKILNEDDKITLRLAETILLKKKLSLQAEAHHEPDFLPKRKDLIPFIEEKIHNSPDLKKSSIKKIIALKQNLIDFKSANLRFEDLTDNFLEKFKNYLKNKYARATADRYFCQLKTTLNQAVKERIITFNPMSNVKGIGRDKSLPKYLTIEEIQTLSNTPCTNPEVKRAFLFGCFSGLRIGNVQDLRWENIIESNGLFYINFLQVKSPSEEINPLSPEAVKLLGERGESEAKIFKLPHQTNILRGLKVWAKKAGIKRNIYFHMSRHSFGTLCISSDIDLYTTSKLMGHSDVKATQIYAKVIDKRKEVAINKLPMLT